MDRMTINVIGGSNSHLILEVRYQNQSTRTFSSIIDNYQLSMISPYFVGRKNICTKPAVEGVFPH